MSSQDLAPQLAEAGETLPDLVWQMERHVPYAACSLSRNSGLRITVTDREQRIIETPPSQGLVLSAWNGTYFQEWASSDLTAAHVRQAAEQFAAGIALAFSAQRLDPGPETHAHYATACVDDPADSPVAQKLELCRNIHQRARKLDTRIVNVQVQYSETLESKVFANRAKYLSQNVLRLRLTAVIFVSDGKQMQYEWATKEGTAGLELAQFSDDELQRLCARAVSLLSAEKVPPGLYDVICSPDVSGVIAHEAFGHGVELDMFLKGRARSQEYLGKAVASPLVDILDDPSYPGAHGSYFFDDEGQLAAPTFIIRRGIFERGLSDLLSAYRLGVPRSANGRRESFEHKIYARMSNTFFCRGETPVRQMIESIDHGVYLQHTSSGMEDPKGWGMQVTSQYGEEIQHGRLTGKLFAPIGITGYVPDILQSVSAVGNDFALSGGTCGKGHKEWVPVSSGGPHLKLKARLG